MADFDNGLPPSGTDISQDSISNVTINSSELIESDSGQIGSVHISNGDLIESESGAINDVLISKEDAGSNMLFIYYL